MTPTPWLAVHGGAQARWALLRVERGAGFAAGPRYDPGSLRLAIGPDLDPAELVHPLLGRIAAAAGVERGLEAIHAGAVGGDHDAWAVVGPKRAGKSTLLAACAAAGLDVVTDDVLVLDAACGGAASIDGGAAPALRCLAGPRCLDLRPDLADRFGTTTPVRPGDPRARFTLAPTVAERPLAGIVHLAWGPDCSLRPLPARDALARLLAVRARDGWPRGARGLLDLAALPTLELRRPREWEALPETVERLRDALALDRDDVRLDAQIRERPADLVHI